MGAIFLRPPTFRVRCSIEQLRHSDRSFRAPPPNDKFPFHGLPIRYGAGRGTRQCIGPVHFYLNKCVVLRKMLQYSTAVYPTGFILIMTTKHREQKCKFDI
jgi:hypothetical protein